MNQRTWRQQSLLLLLIALQGAFAPIPVAAEEAPVKRLKRLNPYQMGGYVDDHFCTRERVYREEDYLAALTDKEIAEYEAMANKGDAEAMYLLALISKETPAGGREYPYRNTWLPRAEETGHPIARYERALEKAKIPDDAFLALAKTTADPAAQYERAEEFERRNAVPIEIAEAAALAQGSGEIAARLAFAYFGGDKETTNPAAVRPRPFRFLSRDTKKALHWAHVAAGKGNILVAERLCVSYINGAPGFGIDEKAADSPKEAVKWCTLAAQAPCSTGAIDLATLYRKGIGVPRSLVDALYWKRIGAERYRRAVSVNKWEYAGD